MLWLLFRPGIRGFIGAKVNELNIYKFKRGDGGVGLFDMDRCECSAAEKKQVMNVEERRVVSERAWMVVV